MAEMKREIKDSVFTYLFRQPEYTLQLYQALHPEDTSTTEADLKLVTLENILSNGLYNDLGIQVGNAVMVLTEAQSTFSVNITLRMLMYLARTYQAYVDEEKIDLYGSTTARIPRPELYVVYAGGKKDVPEILHLSELYEGEGSVDLSIRVLRRDGTGNIVDQYLRFCEIADEQRRKHGYTQEAIDETIRLCLEEGILAPFLMSRKKEVEDIMITLFSQEKVSEIHDYNIARNARAEGLKEGLEQGLAQGHERGTVDAIKNMIETLDLSASQAMDALKIPQEEHSKFLMLLSMS